jgi:hypothetical protein
MPPTRGDQGPDWDVHISPEAQEWLFGCTTDMAALPRVMSEFAYVFQRLELVGPHVGEPDIKKLIATNQLWEARVKDSTGAYRMFFRFGKRNRRRIVAVAYGRKKSEQNFPRSVIDLAQRKVDAYLGELGADGFAED